MLSVSYGILLVDEGRGLLRRHSRQEAPLCADVYVCLQSMLCQWGCHVAARAARGGRSSRGRERPAFGAVAEVRVAFSYTS